MFDRLYFHYTHLKKPPIETNYSPKKAILSREFTEPGSKKLMVIFPHWHSTDRISVRLYKILMRRLNRRGWAALYYQFNPRILEADDQEVVASFKLIQKQVAAELSQLVEKHGYQEIQFVGFSLGNVSLTMVTDIFPRFNGATLVVPGDDLAVAVWRSFMTQDMRKAFEHDHIGITKLDRDWKEEAPKKYVSNFAKKPVTVLVSLTDKVIETKHQKKMADLIAKSGGEVTIKTTHLGHVMSVLHFCLYGRLPK